MNVRYAQEVMRIYQLQNGFKPGDSGMEKSKLFDSQFGLESEPVCPGGGTYTWLEGEFPEKGVLILRCSDENHLPSPLSSEDW